MKSTESRISDKCLRNLVDQYVTFGILGFPEGSYPRHNIHLIQSDGRKRRAIVREAQERNFLDSRGRILPDVVDYFDRYVDSAKEPDLLNVAEINRDMSSYFANNSGFVLTHLKSLSIAEQVYVYNNPTKYEGWVGHVDQVSSFTIRDRDEYRSAVQNIKNRFFGGIDSYVNIYIATPDTRAQLATQMYKNYINNLFDINLRNALVQYRIISIEDSEWIECSNEDNPVGHMFSGFSTNINLGSNDKWGTDIIKSETERTDRLIEKLKERNRILCKIQEGVYNLGDHARTGWQVLKDLLKEDIVNAIEDGSISSPKVTPDCSDVLPDLRSLEI